MLNPYYDPYWIQDDFLEHHGVKGQRWGVRRYQNADGTLTEAGKKRKAELSAKLTDYDERIRKHRDQAGEYEIQTKGARNFAAIMEQAGRKQDADWAKGWEKEYGLRASENWNLAAYYTKQADKQITKARKQYGDRFVNTLDEKLIGKGRASVYEVVLDDGRKMMLTNEEWEKAHQDRLKPKIYKDK